MNAAVAAHARRSESLAAALREGTGPIGLSKSTSNLFRDRASAARRRLDVRAFSEVLAVDPAAGLVDSEGMVTYEALVAECLAKGVMPTVVPQLKTITLGGAVAGVGIESSSHRHGLVHEGVEELEVLTGDGRVIVCTPANEYADLFFGFPNSYGTLGYALRVKARVVPVKRFVHLEHIPFARPGPFFAALQQHCGSGDADFVDGTVFSPERMFLTLGRLRDDAPYTSDYTFEHIYYRSIAEHREDWLTIHDYLWRWDTDWFWCSKNLLAQNPLVRRIYGRKRLGSRFYTKLMRFNSRLGATRVIDRVRGLHSESVIQDVDIPVARCCEFLEFYAREIGIWPVWICPIGPQPGSDRWPLYSMPAGLHVNFGFWDVKRTSERHDDGYFNRLIEQQVTRLHGIKSLYSDSYFPREEFEAIYGGPSYRALKSKYDPGGVFPTLYEKCVLRR